MTTRRPLEEKPSISTRSWLSVCSRSEFVVAAAAGADGVELVDEEDRGLVLARLVEQAADARGAEAGEHLDEGRRRLREELRVRLVRHGLREQRLAGAGRPVQEDALRHPRAEPLELPSGSRRNSTTSRSSSLASFDAGDLLPADLLVGLRLDLHRLRAGHHLQRPPQHVDDRGHEHEADDPAPVGRRTAGRPGRRRRAAASTGSPAGYRPDRGDRCSRRKADLDRAGRRAPIRSRRQLAVVQRDLLGDDRQTEPGARRGRRPSRARTARAGARARRPRSPARRPRRARAASSPSRARRDPHVAAARGRASAALSRRLSTSSRRPPSQPWTVASAIASSSSYVTPGMAAAGGVHRGVDEVAELDVLARQAARRPRRAPAPAGPRAGGRSAPARRPCRRRGRRARPGRGRGCGRACRGSRAGR